ncbi:hypothetical protein [Egicoccus sp. AB-alg2]|uniref:hypothetical protein n=1 Tax=Egicoccus sp. AB-alg2 TaxID=3242693 RepID=UPI00359D3208
MTRTVLTGAVIALVAAGLAVAGGALGITTLWPVLLAAAIGLAGGHVTIGRVAGFVIGSVAAFVAMAVQAGVLPALPSAQAIVLIVVIVVLTVVAAVSGDRVPLWAGLAGYAAFAALYEPMYADRPTAFLAEAPVAFVTVLLATALGAAAATLAELVTANLADRSSSSPVVEPTPTAQLAEGEAV